MIIKGLENTLLNVETQYMDVEDVKASRKMNQSSEDIEINESYRKIESNNIN